MNNQPKRSLYRYYAIILIIILALNFIVMPLFNSSRMETTTYSDFLDSIEEKDVENVQIDILPGLPDPLQNSRRPCIREQTSPTVRD